MLEFLFLTLLVNSLVWCLQQDKSKVFISLTVATSFRVFSRKSVHVSILPAGSMRFNLRRPQSDCDSSPRCHSMKTEGWGLNKQQCTPDVWGGHLKDQEHKEAYLKKIPFNAINIYTKSKKLAEFKLVLYESHSTSLTPSSFNAFWIKPPQRRCHSYINFFFFNIYTKEYFL